MTTSQGVVLPLAAIEAVIGTYSLVLWRDQEGFPRRCCQGSRVPEKPSPRSGVPMNSVSPIAEPALPSDFEPGYLEYRLRTTLQDLARLYGFELTRDITAGMLNEIADGRRNEQ